MIHQTYQYIYITDLFFVYTFTVPDHTCIRYSNLAIFQEAFRNTKPIYFASSTLSHDASGAQI